MQSIDAFRNCTFTCSLYFLLPKSSTVSKLSSFNCNRVSSRSLTLSNNFLLMFKKLWQCRKKWSVVVSGLILQEHSGFTQSAKLCLNLCSLRWLRPRCKGLRSLIPTGLWILYVEIAWGWPIFSNEALKKENDVAPLNFLSSLFHSFMTFEKKWILECISST